MRRQTKDNESNTVRNRPLTRGIVENCVGFAQREARRSIGLTKSDPPLAEPLLTSGGSDFLAGGAVAQPLCEAYESGIAAKIQCAWVGFREIETV